MSDEELKKQDVTITREGSKASEASSESGSGDEFDRVWENFTVDMKGIEEAEPVEEREPEERGKRHFSDIISWLVIIAIAVVFAIVVNNFVILKTVITSGSMRPTMEIGEHVIANRLAYLFSEPKRGDMVFFANPEDETETYVKRIIGLPGEKVEIRKGKIYINDSDSALKEPYLFEKAEKLDFGPFEVPANSYFMLGDNRNISHDSRFWKIPYVQREKIYGKAMFGYRVRKMESAEY